MGTMLPSGLCLCQDASRRCRGGPWPSWTGPAPDGARAAVGPKRNRAAIVRRNRSGRPCLPRCIPRDNRVRHDQQLAGAGRKKYACGSFLSPSAGDTTQSTPDCSETTPATLPHRASIAAATVRRRYDAPPPAGAAVVIERRNPASDATCSRLICPSSGRRNRNAQRRALADTGNALHQVEPMREIRMRGAVAPANASTRRRAASPDARYRHGPCAANASRRYAQAASSAARCRPRSVRCR